MKHQSGLVQALPSAALAGLLGAAGCVGIIGGIGSAAAPDSGIITTVPDSGPLNGPDGGGGGPVVTPSDGPTQFTCNPTQKPGVDQLRALSTAQYQNTLSDLTAWAMNDPNAGSALLTEVASALASIPPNVPTIPDGIFNGVFPDGGWLRGDQSIQLSRISGFYYAGVAVGNALTESSRFGTVVGSCATDSNTSNDAACLTSFIQNFGARALRRAITSDDVTMYSAVYGTDTTASPAAYADVIAVILNAPEFLYFVEHGDQAVASLPGVYTLSSYELASRLSYHLWDTMPDTELWGTAVDGSILQTAVYQREVSRMFADPRARATMHRFFQDYLQVNSTAGARGTGGINYHNLAAQDTDPQFVGFAGADLPTAQTYQNMVADSVSMLDYYSFTTNGTIHDLLTSDLSFAQTADVAHIYGVPVWDGTSTPPSLPAGQRPGLFSRALVVSAGLDSSPILKGVFLRRYLLCDTISPPPPQAAMAVIPITTTGTTRQEVTAITSVSPCNGCHTPWINPLGFATEDFDGLGRYRTAQALYNTNGTVANSLPIDTSSTPYVEMGDSTTTVAGMSDLMALVEASNKPAACLTRNYFRYTFGRFEDLTLDACTLESVRMKLANGGSLGGMLQAIVNTPGFQQRTFE